MAYNIGKRREEIRKNMNLQDENLNKIINVTKKIQILLEIINKHVGNKIKFKKIYDTIYGKTIYYNQITKEYYTIENNKKIDVTTLVDFANFCMDLSDIAYKDELTKIYNRRKMKEIITEIFINDQKDDIHIAIIDLDNFKKINDKYGHPNGDKVLEKLVTLIKKFIKEPDMLFRYGGEEFTIIFRNKNKNEVLELLTKIKKHINDALFLNEIKCSVSIGVAQKKDTYENTIKLADDSLYFVKQNGKNGICYENKHDKTIENKEKENKRHIKTLTIGN